MPFILNETQLFTGSATTPGASFGPWAQVGVSGQYLGKDGSGNLIATSPSAPCNIWKSRATVYESAVEIIVGPWDASFDSNTIWDLQARIVDPVAAAGGGGTFLDTYGCRFRGNHNIACQHGETALNTVSWGTPVNGHFYQVRCELRNNGSGGTTITVYVADFTAAPSVWLNSACSADDSTANLNNVSGTYDYGIACRGSAFVGSGSAWKTTSFQSFDWVTDTTGPVLGAGVIHPSGTAFTINVIDTPNYNPPVLPAYGVIGLTLEYSTDNGSTFHSLATVGPVLCSRDTAYPARLTGAPAVPVDPSWAIYYTYSSLTGNITDSNPGTPNPAVAATRVLMSNYSTYNSALVSSKAVMVLGSRGIVGVLQDPGVSNHGVVACSLGRHELPYGASSGWKMPFEGFSDGLTTDTLIILEAAVWIQQTPSEPRIRIPITFSASGTITLLHDTIVECDPISMPVLPGGVVWTSLNARCGLSATGMPWQTWLYTQETVTGAEDRDGTLSFAYGSGIGSSLVGNYDHTQSGPFTTGSYCCRGYRPMSIVGKPHPSFTGVEVVIACTGDSITKQFSDNAPNDAIQQTYRGWQGRAFDPTFPNITFAIFGSSGGSFPGEVGTAPFVYFFGTTGGIGRKITHAIYAYDVNDSRAGTAVATIWALFTAWLAICVSYNLLCVRTTITTFTTGDLSGQGATDGLAVTSAKRQQLNNMTRHLATAQAGCIGIIDFASVMEHDPINGDNLKYDGTAGELHPLSDGHARMGALVNKDFFLSNPNPILSVLPTLTVVQVGLTYVLTWPPDNQAIAYKISRAPTKPGQATLLAVVAAPATTYTDMAPLSGANYYELVPEH